MLLVEVVLTQLMVRALLRVCIFDTDNYCHYVIAKRFIYLLLLLVSLSFILHIFYSIYIVFDDHFFVSFISYFVILIALIFHL